MGAGGGGARILPRAFLGPQALALPRALSQALFPNNLPPGVNPRMKPGAPGVCQDEVSILFGENAREAVGEGEMGQWRTPGGRGK